MISKIVNSVFSTFSSLVDEIPGTYVPQEDLEHTITSLSFRTVLWATVLLIAFVIIAMNTVNRFPKIKLPLFILIMVTVVGATFTLIGSTVYLNVTSDSGGPVHWHADIEMWVCGNEVELRDPVGLSNKIGTATLHEHNDHRIHLEGVVVDDEIDASLGKFMYVVGGTITEDALIIPVNPIEGNLFEDEVDGDGPSAIYPDYLEPYVVNDGENGRFVRVTSGQTCNGEPAEVQTFVFIVSEDGKSYEQFKLDSAEDLSRVNELRGFEPAIERVNQYSISENPNVPPGDCIIFEFDVAKDKTDKLCEQFGIRDIERCEEFGVDADKRSICEMTQTNYDPNVDYRTTDPNAEIELTDTNEEQT